MIQKTNKVLLNIRGMANALATVQRKPKEFKFHSTYEFVAKMGKSYNYAPLDSQYHLMAPKQCFFNAAQLAMIRKLVYVEGYAMLESIDMPIHHAWCTEPGSLQVIDPTSPNCRYYFGVPFKPEAIAQKYERGDEITSLIDDYVNNFPLLRMNKKELKSLIA